MNCPFCGSPKCSCDYCIESGKTDPLVSYQCGTERSKTDGEWYQSEACKKLAQSQARIQELEGLVKKAVSLGTYGQGTDWFCCFCGNHGSAKLHYDNCFTQLPEIKSIMEAKPCPEHPPNPADNPTACLACISGLDVDHTCAGAKVEIDLTEFAVLKVCKSTMPPWASLVVCYEVGGVPVLADERYPEFVVVQKADLDIVLELETDKTTKHPEWPDEFWPAWKRLKDALEETP